MLSAHVDTVMPKHGFGYGQSMTSTVQALSQGASLSLSATPEWKRVQPLSRRLVPETLPCAEVRPIISSRDFSTSVAPGNKGK